MPRRTLFSVVEEVVVRQLPRRYDIDGYDELLSSVPSDVLAQSIATLVCNPRLPPSMAIDAGR